MGYTKITTIIRYSDVSDYSDNLVNRTLEDEYTSTKCERFEVTCAAGVKKTIDLSSLFTTAIKSLVINNTGSENYVLAELIDGGVAYATQRIPAGESNRFTYVFGSALVDLTANTTDAVVEILVFGT